MNRIMLQQDGIEHQSFVDHFTQRLMKAQALGDSSSLEFMRGRRILEVNPDHPIIKDLNHVFKME
ncbi:Heat shock protein-5 [Arachis hypogaea]|nr:Heat shock protein-5 [Arachis hypogaea]